MVKTVQRAEHLSRESDEAFRAGSETQPLLNDAENQSRLPKITPLPKRSLAILCALRLVEPIAFTQIFPYVNEMINDLHLTDDINRIGFYSGLVVGVSRSWYAHQSYNLFRRAPLPSHSSFLSTNGHDCPVRSTLSMVKE
jgi:hypothetical protein